MISENIVEPLDSYNRPVQYLHPKTGKEMKPSVEGDNIIFPDGVKPVVLAEEMAIVQNEDYERKKVEVLKLRQDNKPEIGWWRKKAKEKEYLDESERLAKDAARAEVKSRESNQRAVNKGNEIIRNLQSQLNYNARQEEQAERARREAAKKEKIKNKVNEINQWTAGEKSEQDKLNKIVELINSSIGINNELDQFFGNYNNEPTKKEDKERIAEIRKQQAKELFFAHKIYGSLDKAGQEKLEKIINEELRPEKVKHILLFFSNEGYRCQAMESGVDMAAYVYDLFEMISEMNTQEWDDKMYSWIKQVNWIKLASDYNDYYAQSTQGKTEIRAKNRKMGEEKFKKLIAKYKPDSTINEKDLLNRYFEIEDEGGIGKRERLTALKNFQTVDDYLIENIDNRQYPEGVKLDLKNFQNRIESYPRELISVTEAREEYGKALKSFITKVNSIAGETINLSDDDDYVSLLKVASDAFHKLVGHIIRRMGQFYHPMRMYEDGLKSEIAQKIFGTTKMLEPCDGIKLAGEKQNECPYKPGILIRVVDFAVSLTPKGKLDRGGAYYLQLEN